VKDGSITLRERDSTQQVRGSEAEILQAVRNLIDDEETWQDVAERLPLFSAGDADADAED
jgi:glycyl-tRNA synthetase